MHSMTENYLIAALWSSTDNTNEQGGDPLDANYSLDDIAPESVEQAEKDCLAFIAENDGDIDGDYEQAGYDFWLTRNHHGAGFWDGDWDEERNGMIGQRLTEASHKFGEVNAVVGDDGKIYLE